MIADVFIRRPVTAIVVSIVIVLIGLHAQKHFLGRERKPSLTETVRAWREYAPGVIPLPHPSPRNIAWFMRNPWFEGEVLPVLRERVRALLADPQPLK